MDLFEIRKKLSMGMALQNMKLRVTDYSRVSTDHMEQRKSLINQKEHFEEMIRNNKNWTYVPGYVDAGISGTCDKKRSEFMRMIRDAQDGKFDLIITKEISRFSRNTLDSIKYTRDLLTYGVAVYFVSDNINTIMPDSELRLTIMASLAQDEVRRLSERVKFGMNRSIKRETILGNNSILGYDKDNTTGNLLINKEEATVVKQIYKMYALEKLSLNKIANLLNKGNNFRSFKAISVERIIANPKYKGYFCGKKTEVIDYITKKVKIIPKSDWIIYKKSKKIPVIINEELWELANKRLQERKRKEKSYKSYQNNYLFTGKLICSLDQMPFYRRKQCKANNEITWLCANYLKKGKQCCDSPNIRESELREIFKKIINELEINNLVEILIKMYEKFQNKKMKYAQNEKKRKYLKKKINKLVNLYIEETISKEEYLEMREQYLELIRDTGDEKNNYVLLRSKILQLMESEWFIEKIITLILDKILVKKNNQVIELKIILNIEQEIVKRISSIFEGKIVHFNRGFNVISTKRYVVNYRITLENY